MAGRGPSGSNVVFDWRADALLNAPGVWRHLQNPETTTSNQVVSNWPTGTATRTTLPTMARFDGTTGRVVRFDLRNGDRFDTRSRCELSGAIQPWTFHEGDETWIQYAIMFPADFQISGPGYFIITQFHGGSGASIASPPITVGFDDARNLRIGGNADDTGDRILLTKAEFDARRGKWIDLNIRIVHSVSASIGGLEVHLNGVLTVPWHNRVTMTSSESYFKYGMYRNTTVTSNNVIFFDGLRVSTGTQVGGGEDPSGGVGVPTSAEASFSSGATSLTVTTPEGAVAGETLVAFVTHHDSTTVPPTPAGWTLGGSVTAEAPALATSAFYRTLAAAPEASYTFPITGGPATAVMQRVAGVVGIDATATAVQSGAATSFTLPSATTASGNVLTLAAVAQNQVSSALSVPSTMTELWQSTGVGKRVVLAQENRASAGAIGSRTFTSSSATAHSWTGVRLHLATTATGAPTVDAGADASVAVDTAFTRTASENDHGSPITARVWTILSGPASVGTVLSTARALSWTPAVDGSYVLEYAAQNVDGIGRDTLTLTVTGAGTAPSPITRVQTTSAVAPWSSTPTHTELRLNFATPTAGSLLVAEWSVDGDAGTLSVPSTWTVLVQRSTPSTSMIVAYKISTGIEEFSTGAWTNPVSGASAVFAEYAGVDPNLPFGPSNFPSYSDVDQSPSLTLDPAAATRSGAGLAFIAIDSAGGPSGFLPQASGWTLVRSETDPGSVLSPGVALLEDLSVADGEDIAATFSWSYGDQRQGYIVLLNATTTGSEPGGPGDPPPPVGTSPTLRARWVGMPETGVGRVTVNTTAVRARLRVGSDPNVTTDVVYGPYGTPNAQGDVALMVGLPQRSQPTKLYYRVAMVNSQGGEWLDTESVVGSFWLAPSGRAPLSLDFGSCHRFSNYSAVTAMANRDDHLAAICGDFYYDDNSGSSVSNFRSHFDAKIRGGFARLLASRGTIYVPDDHDGMANDSTNDAHPTNWTNYNQVHREKVASPPLPASKGLYWTRPWGTAIRIIALDTRSFSVRGSTVLGSTQKAWLKATLDAMAGTSEEVAVIVQGGVWNTPSTGGEDGWEGAIGERNEIGDFIASWRGRTGKNCVMLAGDMHAVAAGVGARGGFPLYHAAPLDNASSNKGGPYTDGPYPGTSSTHYQQYGRLTITPHPDGRVVSDFRGYSASGTQRVSRVDTFQGAVPPPEETVTAFVGGSQVAGMFVGGSQVTAAYVGGVQVA